RSCYSRLEEREDRNCQSPDLLVIVIKILLPIIQLFILIGLEAGEKSMNLRCKKLKCSVLLAGAVLWLLPAIGFSQSNFYEGKTVTLIATTSAGGTGDFRVKAVQPFLKKHIPGNPTVIIQYIDGGGGRKGANHLYSNVRPDGLTIGAASGAIIGLAVM